MIHEFSNSVASLSFRETKPSCALRVGWARYLVDMRRFPSSQISYLGVIAFLVCVSGTIEGQSALFLAARDSQMKGDLAQAEKQYRIVLRHEPRLVSALTNLGVVLVQQGRLTEGIEEYRAALRVDPHSLQARVDLGLAYFRSEQWRRAGATFQEVLARSPDDRRCRQLLAISDMHAGDYTGAATAFERLLPSDYPEVLVGLAATYKDLGRTEDSDRMLQQLLASQGESSTALYLLGMADYTRGDYPSAATHLAASLKLAPVTVEAHFYLGATYFKQRDFPAALAEWKTARDLAPDYFPAVFSSGALLIDQHDAQSAAPLLEHAHKLRPQDGNVQVALARADIDLDRMTEALALLQSGVRSLPDSQPVHFLLARTLKQMGHPREAALEFARCKTLVDKDTASLIEPADAATQ